MYVTRPLSLYLKQQGAVSAPPPEGPNSGYVVISDEEAETGFGLRRVDRIRNFPLPQNKDLTIAATDESNNRVIFIPVLNQPLSANRYYVIFTQGWDEGEAITSSKEDDKVTCCWWDCIQDASPSPLQPFNIYQQFEITEKPRGRFEAKSIAPDGFPPVYLRGEWKLYNNIPHHCLNEALGLNPSLRVRLPDFNFSSSNDCSHQVVVGKWYCPFMFVKEHEKRSKDMMERSMFYEMTLEQRWVKIFAKENSNTGEDKEVLMEIVVQTEAAKIAGIKDAFWDEKDTGNGVLWFTSCDGGKVEKIGLSMAIVERVKWEQQRVGWVGGENQRLVKVEKFGGSGMWRKFSCYLLMESFVLKTMDGSLVLTYDFKHTHQIRCKWE